jgi:hypothetical protein
LGEQSIWLITTYLIYLCILGSLGIGDPNSYHLGVLPSVVTGLAGKMIVYLSCGEHHVAALSKNG